MNIVLDTSVLIAAFYHHLDRPTFTKDVYDYVVRFNSAWVSDTILKEFMNKCRNKLKMRVRQVHFLESLIKKRVKFKPMKSIKPEVPLPCGLKLRDEKDAHVIEFALGIHADMILTWDKDMLDLKQIGKLKIHSPRTFWDTFIA